MGIYIPIIGEEILERGFAIYSPERREKRFLRGGKAPSHLNSPFPY